MSVLSVLRQTPEWEESEEDDYNLDDVTLVSEPSLQQKYAGLAGKAYNPDEPRDDHGRWSSLADPLKTTSEQDATIQYANWAARLADHEPFLTRADPSDSDTLRQGLQAHLPMATMEERQSRTRTRAASDYLYEIGADAAANAAWGQDLGPNHPAIKDAWLNAADSVAGVAVNEATRELFNLPQTPSGAERLAVAQRSLANSRDPVSWGDKLAAAKEYVSAQYQATQDAFAKLGMKPTDTVDLYRGFGRKAEDALPGVNHDWVPSHIDTRAATSWSTSPTIARTFSSDMDYEKGYILHARVPVKDILATGFTGLGSPTEQEVVVIGSRRTGRAIQYDAAREEMNFFKAYARLAQKFNPNHDERGRFASGPANETLARQGREGGFSIDPFTGHVPKKGWMVSTAEAEKVFSRVVTSQDIADYVKAHEAELRQPRHFLGGWQEDPHFYLDVSQNVDTWEEANRLAIARNQFGVYNNEEPDENKRYVAVDSARNRGEKVFKPRADGTHPPIIWLDPNDPQGAADALMLAMYGTKEKVAEALAKYGPKEKTPDDGARND